MFTSTFTIIASLSTAWATAYLDVQKELEQQALQRIQQATSHTEAMDLAEHFSNTVFPSAQLYYEVALSINKAGDIDNAIRCYQHALQLDDAHQGALYDLAEIHLLNKDYTASKQYLLRLASQQKVHWVVYYRLAQISAYEHQTAALEKQLRQAIRLGMPHQILRDDGVQWRQYLSDTDVALSLEMFLHAIGQSDTWQEWTTP